MAQMQSAFANLQRMMAWQPGPQLRLLAEAMSSPGSNAPAAPPSMPPMPPMMGGMGMPSGPGMPGGMPGMPLPMPPMPGVPPMPGMPWPQLSSRVSAPEAANDDEWPSSTPRSPTTTQGTRCAPKPRVTGLPRQRDEDFAGLEARGLALPRLWRGGSHRRHHDVSLSGQNCFASKFICPKCGRLAPELYSISWQAKARGGRGRIRHRAWQDSSGSLV